MPYYGTEKAEVVGQKAGGRRQKDQLQGDSDPPATDDRQIKDCGGGFKPNKFEGKKDNQPSAATAQAGACRLAPQGEALQSLWEASHKKRVAFCPTTSAFQGGSLVKQSSYEVMNLHTQKPTYIKRA
jgi:hypothetical protein